MLNYNEILNLNIEQLKSLVDNDDECLHETVQENIFHHFACLCKDEEKFKILLSSKKLHYMLKEVDSEGDTPLHNLCSKSESLPLVKLLSSLSDLNIENNEGKTPDKLAMSFKNIKVANYLKSLKREKVSKKNKETPILYNPDDSLCLNDFHQDDTHAIENLRAHLEWEKNFNNMGEY